MTIKTPRIDSLEAKSQNIIINGNFDFWQRGNGPLVGATDAYLADRFGYFGTEQVDVEKRSGVGEIPNNLSTYSLAVRRNTGITPGDVNEICQIYYTIEDKDIQPHIGKNMVLSFYAKASHVDAPFALSLRNPDNNRTYVVEYTIQQANVWEKIEIPFQLEDNTYSHTSGAGLLIRWNLDTGSTYQTSTLGVWQSGDKYGSTTQKQLLEEDNCYFQLAQVMLHEGEFAGDFARAGGTIAGELALCQRYYEKSKHIQWGYVVADNSVLRRYNLNYTQEMRKIPEVSWSTSTGSNQTEQYESEKGVVFAWDAPSVGSASSVTAWTADAEF